MPPHPRRRSGLERLREERLVGLGLGADAVGPALAGEGAIGDVGDQQRGDARVVVDDLALGGARLGIQHLVEVRQAQATAVDAHRLLRHRPSVGRRAEGGRGACDRAPAPASGGRPDRGAQLPQDAPEVAGRGPRPRFCGSRAPATRKGLGIRPSDGVHWAHAIDLEGRPDVRARQRAREGVLRDRGPRRVVAPGAQQRRRAHPLPADLRDRRRSRAVPGHRQGVRRRRADGGSHQGRPVIAAQRAQPRDRGRRVRPERSGRSAHPRQGLLPRARLVVAQGLRPAAQDARADRPHRDRAVLAAAEDATRRPSRARRRAGAADAVVGRRGARGRVPGSGRERADLGEGARDVGIPRRQLLEGLRSRGVHRRVPAGAAHAHRREARAGRRSRHGCHLRPGRGGGRRRGHRPDGGAPGERRAQPGCARGRSSSSKKTSNADADGSSGNADAPGRNRRRRGRRRRPDARSFSERAGRPLPGSSRRG